jgi:hypothetical protein
MIMAVSAAPSMVPATPNVEVKKAATVEANPAATTCGTLTTGPSLAPLLTVFNLTYQLPPLASKGVRYGWSGRSSRDQREPRDHHERHSEPSS